MFLSDLHEMKVNLKYLLMSTRHEGVWRRKGKCLCLVDLGTGYYRIKCPAKAQRKGPY
jgi:hypothetical protein